MDTRSKYYSLDQFGGLTTCSEGGKFGRYCRGISVLKIWLTPQKLCINCQATLVPDQNIRFWRNLGTLYNFRNWQPTSSYYMLIIIIKILIQFTVGGYLVLFPLWCVIYICILKNFFPLKRQWRFLLHSPQDGCPCGWPYCNNRRWVS
jgi:hypothetical protein